MIIMADAANRTMVMPRRPRISVLPVQSLLEYLLDLDRVVPLADVKRVRALAHDVGADPDAMASAGPGPVFRRAEEKRSHALAAARLVDDEARDLGRRRRLEDPRDADL